MHEFIIDTMSSRLESRRSRVGIKSRGDGSEVALPYSLLFTYYYLPHLGLALTLISYEL